MYIRYFRSDFPTADYLPNDRENLWEIMKCSLFGKTTCLEFM